MDRCAVLAATSPGYFLSRPVSPDQIKTGRRRAVVTRVSSPRRLTHVFEYAGERVRLRHLALLWRDIRTARRFYEAFFGFDQGDPNGSVTCCLSATTKASTSPL